MWWHLQPRLWSSHPESGLLKAAPCALPVATSVTLTASLMPRIRSSQSPRPGARSPRPAGGYRALELCPVRSPHRPHPERERGDPRARAYLPGWY